jgi:hypothetical protein
MHSGCGCGCGGAASCQTEFQYAVKAVCGQVPQTDPPGFARTAVNIHNPSKCDTVAFQWKVAQAGDLKAGQVTAFSNLSLGPDQALGITNADILARFTPLPVYVDGFVVIESPQELDVVAVYSLATSSTAAPSSFEIERVLPRCVPVCEDLALNISTGVADWQTVSSPETTWTVPIPVQPVTKNGNWATAPAGSIWVSALSTDGTNNAPAGNAADNYTYQLCFTLCSGFTNPTMQLQGYADDSASVYLNTIAPGNLLGTITGYGNPTPNSPPPTTIPLKPSLLQPGQNCLIVVVYNTGSTLPAYSSPSPTGFAIAGSLQVTGGRCPCSKLPLLPVVQPSPVGPASG